MLTVVRSLYKDASSCVCLNNAYYTEWFNVNTGLRQGCSLSTILYINIYINGLALLLKHSGTGVTIGGEKVSILLYANDIV